MRVNRTFFYNSNQALETNIRRLEQDTLQLFECLRGRVRFGENISGEFITYTSNGSADTEDTVAHTIGSIPQGFIVVNIDKAGIVYDSGTAWTSTNLYLKCNTTSATVKLWVIK